MARAAEGRTRNQGNAGFGQQFLGEFYVCTHAFGGVDSALEAREHVESAVAVGAFNPRQFVQGVYQPVVAFFERFDHFTHASLVAIQGGSRGSLGDGAGVGGALGLDFLHGADDFRRAGRVADTPASHGVGLGRAVQYEGAVIQFRAGVQDVAERLAGPQDRLVHVVCGDHDVRVLFQHFTNGLQLFHGVGHAARVGRAVDHEQAGALGNGVFQLFRGGLDAGGCGGFDDHRLAFRYQHHVRVRYPVRRRAAGVVAFDQCGQCQDEKAVVATLEYQYVVGFVIQAVVPFELRNNRFLQGRRTINGGVLGLAVVNGFDGCLFDVLGGVEVRLASTQANDVLASRAEFCGLVGDCEGGGRLDRLYSAGKLKVQT